MICPPYKSALDGYYMYIIVTGAGGFGLSAAEKLAKENHDIVLVDENPDKVDQVSNSIDCQTVYGNAASEKVLKEAGIAKADMILAMTNNDHVNIVTCMIAREYNVYYKLAKIGDPEFYDESHILGLKRQKIVDFMVSPEKAAAEEIVRLFETPLASEFNYFAKGRGAVAAMQVDENHPFSGKLIMDLKPMGIGVDFLITTIDRGAETIIPKGNTCIEPNDMIYIAGAREKIRRFVSEKATGNRQIILVGGNNLSFRVAKALENIMQVKIIEPDYQICEALSTALNKTIILNGEGTDSTLLKAEKIDSCKAIVSVTPDEESNILIGLLGKSLGAQKALCLTQKQEYSKLVAGLGVDATISPRTAAISEITRFVRRGQVEKVISFKSNNVEAIEFVAGAGSPITNGEIQTLQLPNNVVLGGVVSDEQFHLPTGSTKILPGDHVIVFCLPEQVSAVESIFSHEL
jgi:trk system potassium uptake protein TrkA